MSDKKVNSFFDKLINKIKIILEELPSLRFEAGKVEVEGNASGIVNTGLNFGNITGFTAEQVKEIFMGELEKLRAEIGEKFEEQKDLIMNLVGTNIMGAILDLKGDLSTIKASEDSLMEVFERNFSSLKNHNDARFDKLLVEIRENKEDSNAFQSFLERKNCELQSQVAQSVIEINNLKDQLLIIDGKQDTTLEELRHQTVVMNEVKITLEETQESAKQILINQNRTDAEISEVLAAVKNLQESFIVHYEIFKDKNEVSAKREAREFAEKSSKRILDCLKKNKAKDTIPGIRKCIVNVDNIFGEMKKEIQEGSAKTQEIIQSFMDKLDIHRYNKTNCLRCGSDKSVILKCAICDLESEFTNDINTDETNCNYNFNKKLGMQGSPAKIDADFLILGPTSGSDLWLGDLSGLNKFRQIIRKILITDNVKKIHLGKRNNVNATMPESITEFFPNLKRFSLQCPVNGIKQYVLGEKLFSNVFKDNDKKIALYGMQYVESIGEKCFFGINKTARDDFLKGKGFSLEEDAIYFE